MRTVIPTIFLLLVALSCQQESKPVATVNQDLPAGNLFASLTQDNLGDLSWHNPPSSFTFENNSLQVIADEGSDYFNNPEDSTITATAPFLFRQVRGDFVAKALVRPDFSSVWNAASLMVHIDSTHWIKFAFENSDATGPSIVSVVTKGVSDDANGVILADHLEIWLKLIRKGNSYSMLWSVNNEYYTMARLSTMPSVDAVKIGVELQSPVGASATHAVRYFGLEHRTVEDLRKGE